MRNRHTRGGVHVQKHHLNFKLTIIDQKVKKSIFPNDVYIKVQNETR